MLQKEKKLNIIFQLSVTGKRKIKQRFIHII